jgi:hypothetical protein
MKKLLILPFIFASFGVTAQPPLFHELRGFEDSTGTTHLFFRMVDSRIVPCSYIDWEGTEYSYTPTLFSNDVYRINTQTLEESVFFHEGEQMWSECSTTYPSIHQFSFIDGDLSTPYRVSTSDGGWFFPGLDFSGKYIGIGTIGGPFHFDNDREKILMPIHFTPIVIKAWDEPEFGYYTLEADLYASDWDTISQRDLPFDSTFSDWVIAGINPQKNSEYIAFKNDSILFSEDYGSSFSYLFSDSLISSDDEYGYEYQVYQIPDHIEFRTDLNQFIFVEEIKGRQMNTKYQLSRISEDNGVWKRKKMIDGNKVSAYTFDPNHPTYIYYADSNQVKASTDLGNNFTRFFNLEVRGFWVI